MCKLRRPGLQRLGTAGQPGSSVSVAHHCLACPTMACSCTCCEAAASQAQAVCYSMQHAQRVPRQPRSLQPLQCCAASLASSGVTMPGAQRAAHVSSVAARQLLRPSTAQRLRDRPGLRQGSLPPFVMHRVQACLMVLGGESAWDGVLCRQKGAREGKFCWEVQAIMLWERHGIQAFRIVGAWRPCRDPCSRPPVRYAVCWVQMMARGWKWLGQRSNHEAGCCQASSGPGKPCCLWRLLPSDAACTALAQGASLA